MYEKLLKAIYDRNISRYKLAKMSDINPSDLYSMLKGDRKFYDGYKQRICKALNMEYEDLFEEGE